MTLIVSKPQSHFEPAPEGLYQAVCVDVVDKGPVETSFGVKDMVEIRWQLDEKNSKGYRYEVRSRYSKSLGQKARLRQMLEVWRSKKFTPEELQGFDLEKLIGVNCQVQIQHAPAPEGDVYANVTAVVPAPRGGVPIQAENYTREKDRAQSGQTVKPEPGEDDVPF